MNQGCGSLAADMAPVEQFREGCYCRPSDHRAGAVGPAPGDGTFRG